MRQSRKRRDRNRRNTSKVKTQVKKLQAALAAGDKDQAQGDLAETVSAIDRAAKQGVIHDNAAARYKSRLSRRVKALSR
jgi:small subunit ribosomal protein S20